MQTNNLSKIELLKIELFDHLTVCQQMTESNELLQLHIHIKPCNFQQTNDE